MAISNNTVIHYAIIIVLQKYYGNTRTHTHIYKCAGTNGMCYLLDAKALQQTAYTVEQSQNNTQYSMQKNEWMPLVKKTAVSCMDITFLSPPRGT